MDTVTLPSNKISLTRRQEDVLNVIRSHIEKNGIPPTRAEIANSLGFRSVNAAEDHLRALARKGVIILSAGRSRGIQLLGSHKTGLPVIRAISSEAPLLCSEHIQSRLQIDLDAFPTAPDFFYQVHDISMRDDGIFPGDLLAVKKTNTAENGQLVIVRLQDRDICVKRYDRRDREHVVLTSAHPDFAPIGINNTTGLLKIEGVCLGLIRNKL